MSRGAALAAMAVLTAVLSACGSGGGGTSASPAPASSASPSSAPGTPAESGSAAPSRTSGSLPVYQPSVLVSKTANHVQLTSTSSVEQVTAFYDKALSEGGWTVISASKSAFSTSITAKRGTTGTTLSITAAGPAGTTISISTYPL
ncbi:MAG TPA: hypothetical protein VNF47_24740 [Streptosporangiaceae bacterium]|nr:hypothetical protein [Streptosporangiaceae bacterium]